MGARFPRIELKGGKLVNRHVGEGVVIGESIVVVQRLGTEKVCLRVLAPPEQSIQLLNFRETQAHWTLLRERRQIGC